MSSAREDNAKRSITILGDGGWGTALAIILQRKGHTVRLWGNFPDYIAHMQKTRENTRFLPGVEIPDAVVLTASPADALPPAELVIAAIPVIYLRNVMQRVNPFCAVDIPVVSVAKGIENETLLTASMVIEEVLGHTAVAVLSGPSHAEEVARGLPTTVVASARDAALATTIQGVFMSERFRVYTNEDILGVELGGALKNIIAIAAGICEGLGFGDNSKAALIARGLAEISRLGVAMGAKRETFSGLTGLGDLITTCFSPYGRNRRVGVAIGKGKKLSKVLASMEQVAEGIWTTKSACALAQKHKVEMPIANELSKILFADKVPRQAVTDLMTRQPRDEMDLPP